MLSVCFEVLGLVSSVDYETKYERQDETFLGFGNVGESLGFKMDGANPNTLPKTLKSCNISIY